MEDRSVTATRDEAIEKLASEQARYVKAAMAIAEAAEKQGVQLRILGAIAVIIHCQKNIEILQNLRRELTDIDFVGLTKQEKQIEKLFADLGYEVMGGHGVTMDIWTGRRIFADPAGARPAVDIFFDKLDFCHPIDFRNRMKIDFPTISLADIILEKMQIVEINEKDLKDTIVLNIEHDLAKGDKPETINSEYISKILSEDWGFYYTVTTNLGKVKAFIDVYDTLTPAQKERARGQVDKLLAEIENAPKSFKWKMRAKVGPKVKWYKDVADEHR
ncbi:MAG: hypothetical protein M1319_03865, partial [Chloroflexi bacterium]|nr:hypothetical protein [Chloroflexota bacterium]